MYFNAQHLPAPSLEYVAWFDVMGTQASMARSISATANFIFKLHIAALESSSSVVSLYPVMDGVYATSVAQGDMLTFLRDVFKRVAEEFVSTTDNQHRFVIRGGLAFGPVYHGASVATAASSTLASNPTYRDRILLGLPMVHAHIGESSAPPFGLFVHESARTFAPALTQPLHVVWWHWKNAATAATWANLKPEMKSYLAWCAARSQPLQYAKDRISHHGELYGELCALAG